MSVDGSTRSTSSTIRPFLPRSNWSIAFCLSPVPANRFVRTGRGGAGNYHDSSKSVATPSSSKESGSASRSSSDSTSSSTSQSPSTPTRRSGSLFSIGIGGHGNFRSVEEKATLSIDESENRFRTVSMALPSHFRTGIGGFGNSVRRQGVEEYVDHAPAKERRKSKSLRSAFRRRSSVERDQNYDTSSC
ncbi:hypothetical protein NA57DRAFT_79677 [Rhizodiscina lignyota]|uniref:Uncharacterized protein n=1 Tax=Rhizodiscina lignyota TaxID=1504668 RepID=A0A9P4IBF2_9PEZI|nr:hypothetical protein NA57DRAFT_79677 [Rhizodiscina lignyota]